jgi:hypothetical protein
VTPSEFSEHKERDVVLVLHHRHVGVILRSLDVTLKELLQANGCTKR